MKTTLWQDVGIASNEATKNLGDTDGDVNIYDGMFYIAPDPINVLHEWMCIDQPKITRHPTKQDLQDAWYYAIRQDVDSEFSYEVEMAHHMAGYLNVNGFDVNFDKINKFINESRHF